MLSTGVADILSVLAQDALGTDVSPFLRLLLDGEQSPRIEETSFLDCPQKWRNISIPGAI